MALTAVERPATGDPAGLLVLLPGYGDEPDGFLAALDQLDPSRRWHVAVLRPRLDTADGPAWWTVPPEGPDPAEVAASVAALGAAVADRLDHLGLDADRSVVAGFSQGGALALAAVLDGAGPPAGAVAALCAFLPPLTGTVGPGSAAGAHVLVVHAEDDETVDPLLGRSAARALERAGAEVAWHEVPGGHRLAPPLLAPLRSLLDAPPGT